MRLVLFGLKDLKGAMLYDEHFVRWLALSAHDLAPDTLNLLYHKGCLQKLPFR